MVQTMIPKALKPMKFYFSTVYQEIWVGVALTTYTYYKISYGGKSHIIVFFYRREYPQQESLIEDSKQKRN
ncbi:ATP synthase subunit ATP5MJ, mitochondrial [Anomalospiza imberbis]|uniref:ATP synthase subunit ATP5MJ, mitochondrial n=1 Tax=Anomalospiza imberbis TaxID=187417 RepID=UPI00358FD69F